jgi:hypothetical protein
MAISKARIYCKDCQANRLGEKQATSHVLHLILTVLTVGLWLPVWLLVSFINGIARYRCPVCGRPESLF